MMIAPSTRALGWSALLMAVGCNSTKAGPPPIDAEIEHPATSFDAAPVDAEIEHPATSFDAGGDSIDATGKDAPAPPDSLGQSYACMPPANDSSSDAAAGPPTTCVVGQTYCQATRARFAAGAVAQCRDVPAGCASNPTCPCIIPVSLVNCSCDDSGGFAIVTCDRI